MTRKNKNGLNVDDRASSIASANMVESLIADRQNEIQ